MRLAPCPVASASTLGDAIPGVEVVLHPQVAELRTLRHELPDARQIDGYPRVRVAALIAIEHAQLICTQAIHEVRRVRGDKEL